LTAGFHFDYSKIMETQTATEALAALAQAHRLEIFRLLVARGPDGVRAGDIAAALGLAPATLSFHLSALRHAGLVECERAGRERIYRAAFEHMHALVDYLTENCCGGADCRPAAERKSA
jgi:DNA-binding transcriptional ArsR family regulator